MIEMDIHVEDLWVVGDDSIDLRDVREYESVENRLDLMEMFFRSIDVTDEWATRLFLIQDQMNLIDLAKLFHQVDPEEHQKIIILNISQSIKDTYWWTSWTLNGIELFENSY